MTGPHEGGDGDSRIYMSRNIYLPVLKVALVFYQIEYL